jgi:hypothetical protein
LFLPFSLFKRTINSFLPRNLSVNDEKFDIVCEYKSPGSYVGSTCLVNEISRGDEHMVTMCSFGFTKWLDDYKLRLNEMKLYIYGQQGQLGIRVYTGAWLKSLTIMHLVQQIQIFNIRAKQRQRLALWLQFGSIRKCFVWKISYKTVMHEESFPTT